MCDNFFIEIHDGYIKVWIVVSRPPTLQLDQGTGAKPKSFTYNVIIGTEANQEDVIERSGNVWIARVTNRGQQPMATLSRGPRKTDIKYVDTDWYRSVLVGSIRNNYLQSIYLSDLIYLFIAILNVQHKIDPVLTELCLRRMAAAAVLVHCA